jgi:hypothetical protein
MFNTEELLQVQIDWFYRTLVNDSGSNTFIFEAARNVHMVTSSGEHLGVVCNHVRHIGCTYHVRKTRKSKCNPFFKIKSLS